MSYNSKEERGCVRKAAIILVICMIVIYVIGRFFFDLIQQLLVMM